MTYIEPPIDPRILGEDPPPEPLDELLASVRVPTAHNFTARVMDGLPPAPWQRRTHWAVWAAAAAAAVVLMALAVSLTPDAGLQVASAVGSFFATTLAAGAGLLGASWNGLAELTRAAIGGSKMAIAGLALLVIALNAGLVALWRRRKPAADAVRGRRG